MPWTEVVRSETNVQHNDYDPAYYLVLRVRVGDECKGQIPMTFLKTLTFTLILTICLPVAFAADEFQEKELTDANYAKWRDHVLPRNWELSYRKIPWRTSFWDAVIEAQARDKPILLWAMNGHPLCNT